MSAIVGWEKLWRCEMPTILLTCCNSYRDFISGTLYHGLILGVLLCWEAQFYSFSQKALSWIWCWGRNYCTSSWLFKTRIFINQLLVIYSLSSMSRSISTGHFSSYCTSDLLILQLVDHIMDLFAKVHTRYSFLLIFSCWGKYNFFES